MRIPDDETSKLYEANAPRLLVATRNPGKLLEFRALLDDLPIKVITPDELGIQDEISEMGDSYIENAILKARAYMQLSGLPSLADDSGLEVAALDGGPGIKSHRFGPHPQATDADRRAYLLERLIGFPRPWEARFRCAVTIMTPAGKGLLGEGECQGEIIPEERGNFGFGYDPIFFIPEIGLTMAELSLDQKNRISHRARALRVVLPEILSIL